MDSVPNVDLPHRFSDAAAAPNPHAFPHAVVRSSSTGQPKYLLDTSRRTTLAFGFDLIPSWLTTMSLWHGVQVRLLLEIEVGSGSWREANPAHFPGRIIKPGMERSVIQDQERVTWMCLDSEASVTFNDIALNVLSSQTCPPHLPLRFKVQLQQPLGSDMHQEELVAHSLTFSSVSKTISAKRAAEERGNPSGPTENARLNSKKRDDAEKAADAVFEGRFDSVEAALRSGEFDTSAKLTLRVLKCLQLKRSQEERVTRECELNLLSDTFNGNGATPTCSPWIQFDEEKSGVFDDCRGIHIDATRVRFVYNLTVSDGRVEQFVKDWNGSTYDRVNWVGEDECFDHYLEPANKEKAFASAQKELDQLEAGARRLAVEKVANDQKRTWSEKQRMLRSMGQDITQFESPPNAGNCNLHRARNRNTGKALCNLATALADVSVAHGLDVNGKMGTAMSCFHLRRFPKHRSTAMVSQNQGYDECRSDGRRNKNTGESDDRAAKAPVQLDCKILELNYSDSVRNVDHRHALKVLRSIAKKAGYPVAEMLYEATNEVSHKRSTRRENFLPIFDFVDLIKVTQVISDGIALFSKTGTGSKQEKEDWMSGQKNKRKRA